MALGCTSEGSEVNHGLVLLSLQKMKNETVTIF